MTNTGQQQANHWMTSYPDANKKYQTPLKHERRAAHEFDIPPFRQQVLLFYLSAWKGTYHFTLRSSSVSYIAKSLLLCSLTIIQQIINIYFFTASPDNGTG